MLALTHYVQTAQPVPALQPRSAQKCMRDESTSIHKNPCAEHPQEGKDAGGRHCQRTGLPDFNGNDGIPMKWRLDGST